MQKAYWVEAVVGKYQHTKVIKFGPFMSRSHAEKGLANIMQRQDLQHAELQNGVLHDDARDAMEDSVHNQPFAAGLPGATSAGDY